MKSAAFRISTTAVLLEPTRFLCLVNGTFLFGLLTGPLQEDLHSLTRDQTHAPWVEAWSLITVWTARESWWLSYIALSIFNPEHENVPLYFTGDLKRQITKMQCPWVTLKIHKNIKLLNSSFLVKRPLHQSCCVSSHLSP